MFLDYPESTPEKEYCKAYKPLRNEMEMFGKAWTNFFNYGIPPEKSLEAMGYSKSKPQIFDSFEDLFLEAYNQKLILNISNKEQYIISQTKHLYNFELWLEDHKSWIDRDENQFDTFLTKEIFIEFLDYQKNISKSNTELFAEVPKVNFTEGFKDIFLCEDWNKYISAFEKTTPPLLSREWLFIGNRKKHIGVICAWLYELKGKGIIKQSYTRSKLATILNAEIKEFNMGLDGKTFDNTSHEYTNKFKSQLLSITK